MKKCQIWGEGAGNYRLVMCSAISIKNEILGKKELLSGKII